MDSDMNRSSTKPKLLARRMFLVRVSKMVILWLVFGGYPMFGDLGGLASACECVWRRCFHFLNHTVPLLVNSQNHGHSEIFSILCCWLIYLGRHIYIYMYITIYTYVCIFIYIYINYYVSIYLYISIYLPIYMYICCCLICFIAQSSFSVQPAGWTGWSHIHIPWFAWIQGSVHAPIVLCRNWGVLKVIDPQSYPQWFQYSVMAILMHFGEIATWRFPKS